MNGEKLKELKVEFELFSRDMAHSLSKVGINEKEFYDRMHGDLLAKLINLSSMDGYLAVEEVYTICNLLGFTFDPEGVKKTIEAYHFPNADFLVKIPYSLEQLKNVDDAMKSLGQECNVAGRLVDIYNRASQLLIASDGKIEKTEFYAHAKMIAAMSKFIGCK